MTGKSPNLLKGLLTRGAGKQLKQKNKNKKNPTKAVMLFKVIVKLLKAKRVEQILKWEREKERLYTRKQWFG